MPDWGARLAAWLGSRGWACRFLPGGPPPCGLAIRSGRTLTGDVHAVICWDGVVVYDPSPRRYPILEVVLWTLLEPAP